MEIQSSNNFVKYEEIREYVTNYSLLARVQYKAEFKRVSVVETARNDCEQQRHEWKLSEQA